MGRLFFFTASFIAAESLLAISTHTTRPWQWLALLLMIATGLICTLFIARHRFALGISGFVVMALAVLTRLPALFAAPLFDDDYFRFLWDGYQLLSGASPYATTPASHFSQAVGDVAWEHVLSGVNHPDVATIYGPSLQALFWVAALVGGASPIVLKALFVAADIGLVALLLRVGAAPWMVMLYVVNPLAIKEIGFSLHPDGVIALWLTLALFSLQRGRVLRAALYAAAVVCAKLPLLLLAATLNLKNPLHRRMAAWCLLLSVCTYLPFLFPDPALPFIGLREFADVWRYNALGFHLF